MFPTYNFNCERQKKIYLHVILNFYLSIVLIYKFNIYYICKYIFSAISFPSVRNALINLFNKLMYLFQRTLNIKI